MKNLSFTLLLVSGALAAPALAQETKSDWDRIVLEDASGNVMTSTGGDYQSAAIGKQLVVGENMMLSSSSNAKVVYYDLDDAGKVVSKCVRHYTDPSTYIIDATCTPAAAWMGSTAGGGAAAGIILGTGVVAGALLEKSGDNVDVGPLSTAVRHL